MLLFYQGRIAFPGIERLKIYSRNLVGSTGSGLDLSAPKLNQVFANRVTTASNGENGRNGINGPISK